MSEKRITGPLVGEPTPLMGGRPSVNGCGGCTDCCDLAQISVSTDELGRLLDLQGSRSPETTLKFVPDDAREGWHFMLGPCVFRKLDTPVSEGGCTIYEDRPGSCIVFTCELLRRLRHDQATDRQ